MADLSAVVNQLKLNNEEERARDSNLNQNIAQSRLQNSEGLQKLSESIIKNTATMLKDVTVPIVKDKLEQEQKDKEADLFSFSKVIARCLKNYIVDGTKASENVCESCGAEGSLVYQEGCVSCKSCGYSKCG
mgnify:CR=1 FL=1